MKTYILLTDSFDPYYNLAAEELVLKYIDEGKVILHLWQSYDTVVIGKHQNPWAETFPKLLRSENITLA
jgi:lipoate---protein ligase